MNVRFSKNIIFCILLFNMQIMSPALVNGHVGGGGGSANAGAGLYSSTQRRGPIAAEFQGPGPAAVALPSTIGNIREMLSGGGMYIKCESYNLSRRESRGESVSDTSRPARCEQSYNRTLYIIKKPKKKKEKKINVVLHFLSSAVYRHARFLIVVLSRSTLASRHSRCRLYI